MKFLLFCITLLILVGCTQIDYIGQEYPPTDNVDLYFDEDEVGRDYKVMGQLIATAGEWVSAEKMQKKIKKKAMEKGADGVVILGLERYISGETTKYSETTTDKKDKTKISGSSTTQAEEKKEIKAIFIKYK